MYATQNSSICYKFQELQSAMRRAGQNPTESEVQDMINKIDDGSASLSFRDFCLLLREKTKEMDPETHFKDTFRVFSKDEEGRKIDHPIRADLPLYLPQVVFLQTR